MDWLAIWAWLSDGDNQKTIGFWAGGIAVAAAAAWKVFKYFHKGGKKTPASTTVSADHGSTAAGQNATAADRGGIAISGDASFGIPPDQLPAIIEAGSDKRVKLAERVIETLQDQLARSNQDLDAARAESEALAAAVTALAQQTGPGIDEALEALGNDETEQAKAIFHQIIESQALQVRESAAAYRHLGALAFLDNTQEALAAYQCASELDPENLEGWTQLGRLYRRVGRLDDAFTAHGKVMELAEAANDHDWLAISSGHLGILYNMRGDLDQAVEMYEKALAIHETLGRKEGMANQYGNLGLVYQTRGDLDRAEEMHKRALSIEQDLGRKVGIASDYSNLGIVYAKRGDLDQAEEMYKKSIEINDALGRQEGMASGYGNLGLVYNTRGNLDQAEEMLKKALAINQALEHREGMASDYGNLGIVYHERGDLDQAVEMYEKALEIAETAGHPAHMATLYSNIGGVYQARGELDQAEEMLKKALKINQAIGRKEEMASVYANLGIVYHERGDLAGTRSAWEKSVALYRKIGLPKADEIQGGLDELAE